MAVRYRFTFGDKLIDPNNNQVPGFYNTATSTGGVTVTNWSWRGITIREHVVSSQDKVDYYAQGFDSMINFGLVWDAA